MEEKKLFKQTPHPYYPILEDEVIKVLVDKHGEDHVVNLIKKRERSIMLSLVDPLNAGFELDPWKDARELYKECDELLILGLTRMDSQIKCSLPPEAVVAVSLITPRTSRCLRAASATLYGQTS